MGILDISTDDVDGVYRIGEDNSISGSPRDYGIDHDEFRPYQQESLRALQRLSRGIRGNTVIEAPTGSGKTLWPASMGFRGNVVALCRTKSLQVENYADEYDFDELMGRSNYPCVHPMSYPGSTVNDCMYFAGDMHKCLTYSSCPYIVKRERMLKSKKASLNYSLWMYTRNRGRMRDKRIDYLFLDEAHQVPDLVIEWAGMEVGEWTINRYSLPEPPDIDGQGGGLMVGRTENPTGLASEWMARCINRLKQVWLKLYSRKDIDSRKEAGRVERLGYRVRASIDALNTNSASWYIRSGGKKFVAKPLTARHHYHDYFSGDHHTFLMSATIGDYDLFAQELGISNDANKVIVPHVWDAKVRPVHVLDCPRMGYNSTANEYVEQAAQIANAIKKLPRDWTGVVHHSSIDGSGLLAARLAKHLGDRVLLMPQYGTERQLAWWEEERRRVEGAIMISWSMWEGVDLKDDRICIVAKVPFASLGDGYEKARQMYDSRMYLQRAAWQLEQGCGRIRRGYPEHYDTDEEMVKFVAIADGNWTRVRKYLSDGFVDSLVEM